MVEIHPGLLWIGHALDVRNSKELFDIGIRAVVDVAYEEPPAQLPRELIYYRFPLTDGGDNDADLLRLAIRAIVDLLTSDTCTLVGCSAGMSRSPAIAAAALAVHANEPPDSVLQRLSATKSLDVSGRLWADAMGVCSDIRRPG